MVFLSAANIVLIMLCIRLDFYIRCKIGKDSLYKYIIRYVY